MQKEIGSLEKAGIRLAAVSYDSVGVLKSFAGKANVDFPLLSDPDSRTIEAFGIRNTDVKGSRIDGVPHPGTFLIDSKGTIRAKLFYDGYKKRHLAKDILEKAKSLGM